MSVNAETLNVILAARDREFARAMEANTRRIERFAQKAKKDLGGAGAAFAKLGGAVAAFASVAAIQQLGVAVRDAANKLGDLKDAADAIGITTDALQKLQYSAQLSGVSSDVLQTSLSKLSKNLGDAAMGGTTAKKALDTLGLSGASLAAMPLDKALGVVADKMSSIENPAKRAALATELFGKSGLAMVNMLADGSSGLNAMADEAEKLGVVINRDVIENAAAAADKLDAMSMVISANLTEALVNLAPLLISTAQGIASIVAGVNDFLFGDLNYYRAVGDSFKYVKENAGVASNELKAYTDAQTKLTQAENAIVGNRGMAAQKQAAIKAADDAARAAGAQLIAAVEADKAQKGLVQTYKASLHGVSDNNSALQTEIGLLGQSAEAKIRAAAAQEKAATIERLSAQALAANVPMSGTLRLSIEAIATQQEQLTIALEMGKIAQTGATKGMSESAIAALKSKDALAVYQGQVEDLGLTMSEFESISSTIQSSMEDAFMGMVDGTSSAKDAFKSMAADIIKELYRVLVVQRMVGQLATAGKAGSGILGFIGGALGIGMASGGTLQAGQPSVVGEHGRELFVPSSAGRVLSVPQSKAAVNGGGGVTVMQTINITTGVQQTVRAEIRSLMPQIADSAKRAVLDAKQRGGTYGSAF
jgi:hypothetical protein